MVYYRQPTTQIYKKILKGGNSLQDNLYQLVKNNLYVGLVIKNYKLLCHLLEQETKTSDSKKAQEKEWKRYFDWEKKGHKYIIIEVYNEPLEKNDKRSLGNNSIYVQHIELLLLNYLTKQEGFKTTLTLKKLFLLMGMINQNYINEDKEKMKANSEYITDYHINHFYQRTYQKLRKIIFDTLRNLKNRCLIDYEELIMINIKEIINNKVFINTRPATDEEKKNIMEIKKIILNEMGLESITLVHLKFKHTEFYNKINILLKQRYDINYTYTDIKILFTREHIVNALEQAEINMQKIMLNDKIIIAVDEQAEHNLEKSKKNYDEQVEEYMKHIIGKPSAMSLSKFFKLDDVYLYAQHELSELLLRLK